MRLWLKGLPNTADFKSEVDARLGSAAMSLVSLTGVPPFSRPVDCNRGAARVCEGGALVVDPRPSEHVEAALVESQEDPDASEED
jgi:hypothetical protein